MLLLRPKNLKKSDTPAGSPGETNGKPTQSNGNSNADQATVKLDRPNGQVGQVTEKQNKPPVKMTLPAMKPALPAGKPAQPNGNGKVVGGAVALASAEDPLIALIKGAVRKSKTAPKSVATGFKPFIKGLSKKQAIAYSLAVAVVLIGGTILILALDDSNNASNKQASTSASQSGSSAGEQTSDVDELRALLGTGKSEESSDVDELRSLLGTDSPDDTGAAGSSTDSGSASSTDSGSASSTDSGSSSSSSSPDSGSSFSPDTGSSSDFGSGISPPGDTGSSGSIPAPPVSSSPSPVPVTPSPVESPADSVGGGVPSGTESATEPKVDPEVFVLYSAESEEGTVQQVGAVSGNGVGSSIEVGKDPSDVAFSKAGTKAFIVNRGSDSVSVVRLSTGKVVNTIEVGGRPTGISISPGGKRLLVSNNSSGTVSLLNPAGGSKGLGSKLATIDVGASPTGTYIVDKDKAYVALSGSNELAIVDLTAKKKSGQVAVGSSPSAVLGKGSRAYVTNRDSGSVSIINTEDDSVIKTVKVGRRPTAAALSKGGSRLYVVNERSRSVSVINTSSKKVISTFRWTEKRMSAASEVKMKKPSLRGISFDAGTGAVFVTDIANERLWMVDPVKKKILDRPAAVMQQPVIAKFSRQSKK